MYKYYETSNRPTLFIVATVLLSVVAGVLVPLMLRAVLPAGLPIHWTAMLISLFQAVAAGIFAKIMSNTHYAVLEPVRLSSTLRQLPKVLFLSILMFLVTRLITDGIRWITAGFIGSREARPSVPGMPGSVFALALLVMGLIPAVCEEFYYRAVAYHYLRGRSERITVLLSTLCFAMSRIPDGWEHILSAAACGAVLMRLYIDEFNYCLNITTRFLFNAVSLLFAWQLTWITDSVFIPVRASTRAECFWWGLLFLACAAILLLLYGWICGRKRKGLATAQ